MLGHRMTRSPPTGLGLLFARHGMVMVQSKPHSAGLNQAMSWHWQAWEDSSGSTESEHAWPDPKWVKQVKQRCAYKAKLLAMAVPQDQLQSFQVQLEGDVAPSELKAQLRERLQDLLPWPLADSLWDFQEKPSAYSQAPETDSSRPAWLNQAMQQRSVHHIEILAMHRAWAGQCEQWSQQAGLQLVRLEPAWQASQRWQTYLNLGHAAQCQEPPAVYDAGMSQADQAVAGGLALGVVTT